MFKGSVLNGFINIKNHAKTLLTSNQQRKVMTVTRLSLHARMLTLIGVFLLEELFALN